MLLFPQIFVYIKVVLRDSYAVINMEKSVFMNECFVLFTEQILMLDMPYAICSLILGETRHLSKI